ncbi:uncharacterized protein LOC117660964 isoform X1 [Pantherophis guttatus]|uniref:Uncharacterized protein LOC117660964 isoform X1 n=1 Tax=Pantherophis guttatus TaxID=94885 RepID=A0ABM3ZAV1_PANGU|nr:uncharacterized protein LOC117660964 isoform X1 [Pantherophis guttatus]
MGAIRGGSFPLSACPDSDGGGATGRPLGPSWGPAGAAGSEAAFPAGAEKRRRWGDPQLRNAAHAEGLSLQQPEEGRGAGGLQPGRLAKEPLSVRPSPSRVALSSVGARGPLWLLEARARFPLLQETLDARVAATDRCLQLKEQSRKSRRKKQEPWRCNKPTKEHRWGRKLEMRLPQRKAEMPLTSHPPWNAKSGCTSLKAATLFLFSIPKLRAGQ